MAMASSISKARAFISPADCGILLIRFSEFRRVSLDFIRAMSRIIEGRSTDLELMKYFFNCFLCYLFFFRHSFMY